MKFLIVVAHPDDEVLGAGASIYKWGKQGHIVDVCILSADVKARMLHPGDNELKADLTESAQYLGVNELYLGTFPNIEFNTVPHIQLVQFIEKVIQESRPDVVITHHPSDVNNDHLHVSLACQEAIRLPQRRPEVKPIKEFWYMEVPSCSEWATNSSIKSFSPNCYVEIGHDGLNAKLQALASYKGVMRPYPHPRSLEFITGLAAYRGGQFQLDYAEAFEVVLRKY